MQAKPSQHVNYRTDPILGLLEEVGHDACGLNPDIANFIRLHRPIEPVQEMLDKVLPYARYWHVKNYLHDEDPATGQVMTSKGRWSLA
jgi:sugar phosphate isomerase/epimerase